MLSAGHVLVVANALDNPDFVIDQKVQYSSLTPWREHPERLPSLLLAFVFPAPRFIASLGRCGLFFKERTAARVTPFASPHPSRAVSVFFVDLKLLQGLVLPTSATVACHVQLV